MGTPSPEHRQNTKCKSGCFISFGITQSEREQLVISYSNNNLHTIRRKVLPITFFGASDFHKQRPLFRTWKDQMVSGRIMIGILGSRPKYAYYGASRYHLVLPGTEQSPLFVKIRSTKKGAWKYFFPQSVVLIYMSSWKVQVV